MHYFHFIQIGIVAFIIFRIKQSVLKPVRWEEPNPLPSLEGPLEPNDLLTIDKTYQITGQNFLAPESTAFDIETSLVYASFNDGSVRSFQGNDESFRTVNEQLFFTGAYVLGFHTNEVLKKNLTRWCHEEIKQGNIPWKFVSENRCGRPQGLRFRKVNFFISMNTFRIIFG